MKFLMYGAGSIGRGFIGPLFAQAGYEVIFIDVNNQIIDALNKCHSYHYTVTSQPPYDVTVSGVRGVNGLDEQAILNEITDCDLMATSLGAMELQRVSPLIAKGISQRIKQGGSPLNLLICENLKGAAHLLCGWLGAALPKEDKQLLNDRCGLIETAIGRMVPVSLNNPNDPLHITVEEYGFLPVDKAGFIGEPPNVQGLIPYSPFAFYEERKLYMHNMGHAICAYLGLWYGYETIAQAVSDLSILLIVQRAMTESAAMLSIKYGVLFTKIFDHAEDLLLRFGNAALGDTCERVGRDTLRKLAEGDRLAGALSQCWEHSVYPVFIALGYASALRYVTNDFEHAASIAKNSGRLTAEQAELVMKLFPALELPMPKLIKTAEKLKKDLRGNIV